MGSGPGQGIGTFFEKISNQWNTEMSKRPLKFYEFGPFRLNVTEGLLLRDRS
jgi:hypothetical protein